MKDSLTSHIQLHQRFLNYKFNEFDEVSIISRFRNMVLTFNTRQTRIGGR